MAGCGNDPSGANVSDKPVLTPPTVVRWVLAIAAGAAVIVLFSLARPTIQAHLYGWRIVRANDQTQRDALAQRLVAKRQAARGVIESLAHHAQPGVRAAVFRALIGDPLLDVVEALKAGLDDPELEVRALAARAAAACDDDRVWGLLIEALPRRTGEEGMAWVDVLSSGRGPMCRAALLNAIRRHPDPCVRIQAMECIERSRRAEELTALLDVLMDADACDRPTIGEQREMSIIADAQPELRARLGEGDWALDAPRSRTVSEAAAGVLRRCTGLEGPSPSPGASLDAVQADVWRRLLRDESSAYDGP